MRSSVVRGIDLVKRVVVDASLAVDLFVGREPARVKVAEIVLRYGSEE